MIELGLGRMMEEAAREAGLVQQVAMDEAEREYQEAVHSYAMQEGIEPTELLLALEDRGWNRIGASRDGDGASQMNIRRLTIIRARMYWLLDPYATVGVRTWTNYTVGTGVTIKAKDATLNSNIQDFLKSPKNRTMTSAAGQQKHNRKLLVDGEMFFAVFDEDTGTPTIRKVDCLEVTQFIYDPEDAEVIWAFKRERTLPSGDRQVLFYRNWAYPDQDMGNLQVEYEVGQRKPITCEEGVLMYHLPFDAMHQRGNSLFSSSLAWMTSMRQFLQDRISITRGLSKYIYKLTAKGGKNQLGNIGKQVTAQNRPQMPGMPLAPKVDGTLPSAVAKTFLQNGAAEMEAMPRTTGASDAKADHKILRLSVIAGMGITEPYTGDAETGNLATATSMELPMLKQFQTHQKLWQDAWSDLLAIVAYFINGGEGEMQPLDDLDVDYPPIVEADIAKITTAIVATCAEFPELKQPEVLKLLLVTLGINNVDDVMVAVLATAKANQAKADNIANGLNPDGSKKTAAQLAPDPTAVVGPAKPAQQAVRPGGQPVQMQQALEFFAQALLTEAAEMDDHATAE